METNLNANWEIDNQNFDKDVLLSVILRVGEDFGVLYENPIRFKWNSDMWWEQHKRTFTKWFDAFDIPYSPLENYDRHENVLSTTNDKGTSSEYTKGEEDHLGHNIRHGESSGESLDNENSKERNNLVETNGSHNEGTTVGEKSGTTGETTAEATENQKLSGFDEASSKVTRDIYDENKSLDEDDTVDIRQDYTDSTKDTTKIVEKPDSDTGRTVETRVSAYNETDYVNSQKVITKGNMTTEHSLNEDGDPNLVVTHKTNDAEGDDPDANNRTHTTIDRDESVSGLKSGTVDDTHSSDTTEDATGSLDRQVDGEHADEYSEATTGDSTGHRNELSDKDTNSNAIHSQKDKSSEQGSDEFKNKSLSSTEKTDVTDRDFKSNVYTHGNIGVTTAQQMLTQEIQVQLFTIYDQIAELYVDDLCVRVYPSRRGGCCCYDY